MTGDDIMDKSNSTATGASSKKAVILYSVALFVVVVVFIAISYLINERGQDKVEELHEQQTTALQRIDLLRSENERLLYELTDSEARVAALDEELKQAYIDWAEDTKQIEDKYVAEFEDLLSEYKKLHAELEEYKAAEEAAAMAEIEETE